MRRILAVHILLHAPHVAKVCAVWWLHSSRRDRFDDADSLNCVDLWDYFVHKGEERKGPRQGGVWRKARVSK